MNFELNYETVSLKTKITKPAQQNNHSSKQQIVKVLFYQNRRRQLKANVLEVDEIRDQFEEDGQAFDHIKQYQHQFPLHYIVLDDELHDRRALFVKQENISKMLMV